MSNRGVRGVRVVGPGSSRRSGPPADRPTDTGVDERFDPVAPADPPEDAAAAEASAISTIEAVGTEAAGTEAATQEHPEVASAGAGPTPTGASSSRRWRMRLATTLAVLGLAGTVGFGYGYFHLNGQQGDVSAAKKQAQNYIVALTNFDPKGLDNEINKIQSYTTGNFKTSISQFFSNDVRKSLLATNAQSRGEVRSIYPQSNSGGRISFFAVVDDTIANNHLQAPASDEIDMTVDMVKTSQGWRVANNTFLQSPLFSPTQPGGRSTPSTTTPPKP
jgi:hypothetical protein